MKKVISLILLAILIMAVAVTSLAATKTSMVNFKSNITSQQIYTPYSNGYVYLTYDVKVYDTSTSSIPSTTGSQHFEVLLKDASTGTVVSNRDLGTQLSFNSSTNLTGSYLNDYVFFYRNSTGTKYIKGSVSMDAASYR